MHEHPLVSIIIPTYDRAHLIGETLDSVLAQTYTNWECIVVDDGSTDGTDDVLAKYVEKDSRFQYFQRAVNPKGASHCRNVGLNEANGEYCVFLDSDDLLLDFCLERRLEAIKRNTKDLDFCVFPMSIQINGSLVNNSIPQAASFLDEFLKNKIPWGIMCTIWNLNFIKKLKGFNIHYPRLNDPEIHIRAILNSKNGFKVYRGSEADSIYRISNTTLDKTLFSRKYANSLLLFVEDISKNLNDAGLSKKIHLKTGYLSDYFLNYALYNTRLNNGKVLRTFYRNGVISLFNFIKLFFIYYLKVLTLKIDFVIGKKFNRSFRTI